MFRPDMAQAEEFSGKYSIIPVSKEIYADTITPIQALKAIMTVSPRCFLLESVDGGEKWGRYSFIGFEPVAEIKCRNGVLNIDGERPLNVTTNRPSDFIRNILKEYKSPRLSFLPPFTGGFVGYFAYEYAKYSYPQLSFSSPDKTGFDDMDLMLFDKVIAFDHLRQKIIFIINIKTAQLKTAYRKATEDIDALISTIKSRAFGDSVKGRPTSSFRSEMDENQYKLVADKAKSFIKDGDIFHMVLSNTYEADFEGSLFNTYRVLRTTTPSPYMFFLKFGNMEITGASPETLVKLKGGQLSSYPAAGSKQRGATDEEDNALEDAIINDAAIISEHDMLRNDMGKVSKFGSVQMTDYRKIQKHSYEMYISSVVTGKIKDGLDAFDAIDALLPAGRLSGVPKLRAVNIIDTLEKSSRGIYGGAIGYIDFTGNMDVCMAIRMCVKNHDKVYVRAGCGISWKSDPLCGYRQAKDKAQSVINAIEFANEVND